MTQPTSRATLKDYAKRQLGHPVVELNLDDDQMEDRIDDALEFFQEYHFDGTYPTFLKHQITASTLKITSNVSFEAGETITGGTTGVSYLDATARYRIFKDLWEVRTIIVSPRESIRV